MRVTRLPGGKYTRHVFRIGPPDFTAGAGTELSDINPTRFAIELRDKDFKLKRRLDDKAVAVQWEWNRVGGCGRSVITLKGDYLNPDIQPDDDVRIYLTNADGISSTLWYRGYVEAPTPSLEGGDDGLIRVDCMGYFGWVDRLVIHDSNSPKTYSNQEVSTTVKDLVDNFLVANTSITRGTVDASNFTPDTLTFKVKIRDALRTCADLLGDVEYGVDANLSFYWYNQVETVRRKFYLGANITKLSDRVDFKGIKNQIHFEGGGSTPLVGTGTAQDSIDRYGRHEDIVTNGSITTNSVMNQYLSALFLQYAKPQRQLLVSLENVDQRFEGTLPMGAFPIVDQDVAQARNLWGRTANGGANLLWGTKANLGAGALYGGIRREQINRVTYTISPEDGRVNAQVQFGSSITYSRASATIKRIEQDQNTLRQRSL